MSLAQAGPDLLSPARCIAETNILYQAGPLPPTKRLVRSIGIQLHKTFLPTFITVASWFALLAVQSMPGAQALIQQTILTPQGNVTAETTSFTPPLRTAGKNIVDADGKRFKLASINWYGSSDVYFVPGGLDKVHRSEMARTIRNMGFNSVRFPYSDQMVIENPVVDPKWLQANLDLLDPYKLSETDDRYDLDGPRAIEVFDACVKAMTDEGLAVIINNHITNAHWCDGTNLCDSSWHNDQYGPICNIRQTTQNWIDHWITIMRPYIDNPLVIGADLRNEPRGLWGTMGWRSWAQASEQAGEALLKLQPNWLMIVEGISSANDCSGARDRLVTYSIPDRVVYSAHVYKWSGWSSLVPFSKRPYPSFALEMDHNWGFLLRENTAPVWVGEFGVPSQPSKGDKHYWDNLMRYLKESDADFGYWAINAHKPDPWDVESYGLLKSDWSTVLEDYRLRDLRALMQPVENAS